MEMPNFKSKELNRTFNSIFFVQKFSDQPILAGKSMPMAASVGKQVIEMKKGISVKPAEGGITIAELFAKRKTANRTQRNPPWKLIPHFQIEKISIGCSKKNIGLYRKIYPKRPQSITPRNIYRRRLSRSCLCILLYFPTKR